MACSEKQVLCKHIFSTTSKFFSPNKTRKKNNSTELSSVVSIYSRYYFQYIFSFFLHVFFSRIYKLHTGLLLPLLSCSVQLSLSHSLIFESSSICWHCFAMLVCVLYIHERCFAMRGKRSCGMLC